MTAKSSKTPPPTPGEVKRTGLENPEKLGPMYARICLGAFACCLVLLVILVACAERLSRFGILQQVYYLVLVLMSLTAAGFLFGVLRSSATYVGKLWGGTLRLGGAIIGAALVVVGGYYFIPKPTTFSLTVYVHGRSGPQDTLLRNSGRVFLELGPDSRSQPIGENGQAIFPAIPSDFRGQTVQAWVESDNYESTDTNIVLSGASIGLEVKKKIKSFRLSGTVLDSFGKPLAGVRIAVPAFKAETVTNGDGWFELQIVADDQQMIDLVAEKQGYEIKRFSATLGDSGINFSLKRSS